MAPSSDSTSLAPAHAPARPTCPWHAMAAADVAAPARRRPRRRPERRQVAERAERYGPNRLAEPPPRPRWKLFLDQFRSGIVFILIVAAVIAGAVGDLKDTVVIAVVLLINAVLGYVQEAKASNALAALEQMLVTKVRVRRDGDIVEVVTDDLVPGDVVLLEAGDRVPADGRLVVAANLSIDESSLTGESVPVEKDADLRRPRADAPLGDRHNVGVHEHHRRAGPGRAGRHRHRHGHRDGQGRRAARRRRGRATPRCSASSTASASAWP